jgi:hypothetical protein
MRTNQRATSEAEFRFPVRVRLGIPTGGLGRRLDQMNVWLDANCGADGWAITPSGRRGVVNDALAIYFADATLASAFVPAGVSAERLRPWTVYSECGMTSRHRGSAQVCTGHPELFSSIIRGSHW